LAKFLVVSINIWSYMCFADVLGDNSVFIFSDTTHKPTWFTTQKLQCKETTSRSLEYSGRGSGTSQARKSVVMSVREELFVPALCSIFTQQRKRKVIPMLR